jgi:hypothetical protein
VETQEPAEQAPNRETRRRVKSGKDDKFSSFDRAFYMYVKTSDGRILWNRSRSMLNNGHRPSAIALRLRHEFGVQIESPSAYEDPSRDNEVIHFFAQLIMPEDAVAAPSIFDDHGGTA